MGYPILCGSELGRQAWAKMILAETISPTNLEEVNSSLPLTARKTLREKNLRAPFQFRASLIERPTARI